MDSKIKVYAYVERNGEWSLCSQTLFSTATVTPFDNPKLVFDKNALSLWEYFHKQLDKVNKLHKSEYFLINNIKTLVVYGSGLTSEKLNNIKVEQMSKSIQIQKENMNNFIYDEELVSMTSVYTKYRERKHIKKIEEFLSLENPGENICSLYGLRRTGKSVLMYQSIAKLLKQGKKVAYAQLTDNIDIQSVYNEMNSLIQKGYKYFFIDEITYANNFSERANILTGMFAPRGIYIVIAGTDSYILHLTLATTLYNRSYTINTTYMDYSEYAYITGDNDILHYIHKGGILDAHEDYIETHPDEYVVSAISDNIIHSLDKCQKIRRGFNDFLSLDESIQRKFIEQAVLESNSDITLRVLLQDYNNKDLGSALQILEQNKIFNIRQGLDIDKISEEMRYKLRIINNIEINDKNNTILKDLTDLLTIINVITQYTSYQNNSKKTYTLFTQPGLRYNHANILIDLILNNKELVNLSIKDKELLATKIKEDVEGQLLEQITIAKLLDTTKGSKIKVYQFDYLQNNGQFDMVIQDGDKINIYEIKRNTDINIQKQCRWLANTEMNNFFETNIGKINKRIVLYRGNKEFVTNVNGFNIEYKNIEKFLSNERGLLE